MSDLISVHIPKTAGTAFRHVLIEVYGYAGVLEDYPPDRIQQLEQAIDPKIKVIHGHFAADKYQALFPQAQKIVWLRHPLFRLISEYFFAKTINDRANAIHAQLLEKNLGILEFAQIPQMQNFLSQKIAGVKLEEFDFVGIQEFYREDLAELKQILGWQNFQPTVKNSNQYPAYYQCLQEILGDRTLINQLAKLNQEDMQLYERALQLRAKRRDESSLIQSTRADWQRSQHLLQQMQLELDRERQELKQIRYWLRQIPRPNQTLQLKLMKKPQLADLLSGFYFDSPQGTIEPHQHFIPIGGWIIGKNSPADKIIITYNDMVLCEAKVNLPRPDVAQVYPMPEAKTSGFSTNLVVSLIPQQAELKLQVLLKNGQQIAIGTIGCD